MDTFLGFPVLYEDEDVLFYTNGSKEFFVQNKHEPKCTLRIGSFSRAGLLVTAHDCYLSPWAVNGLPAFGVIPKR